MSEHGLKWSDLHELLAAAEAEAANAQTNAASPPNSPSQSDGPQVNVLDLTLRLLEMHVRLTEEQRMAVACWILHTHIYNGFTVSPRLVLTSPVRGCGKTTLLVLLEQLTARPLRTDNVTPAAIYHSLSLMTRTLLIDEGDNLGLFNNPLLRAVFNSGHRHGGSVTRYLSGRATKLATFSPLAVAAIGSLPLPLMHRAVVVNMHRRAPGDPPLEELNELDPGTQNLFASSLDQIKRWASTCSLSSKPDVPPQLHNRTADNWRVLLSIADDLGHGEAARTAALALSSRRSDEDIGVVLLSDIKSIFEASGADRIKSATLVESLVAFEDGQWADWRGVRDDRQPHKLTQSELAAMLREFQIRPRTIRPRTIWPMQRVADVKTARGYWRSQFERAWATYCSSDDTPTQARKVIRLQRS